MRVIRILVPEEDQQDVFAHFEEVGIDYLVLTENSETNAVIVEFSLPTPAVEEILDGLNAAGTGVEYTVVTNAETVETRNFESLEDRYTEQEDKDIAPAELRTRALEMGQRTMIYYTMTLLSTVVAASGLLLDYTDDADVALGEYMDFKTEVMSQLDCTGPNGCWRLTGREIDAMLHEPSDEPVAPSIN